MRRAPRSVSRARIWRTAFVLGFVASAFAAGAPDPAELNRQGAILAGEHRYPEAEAKYQSALSACAPTTCPELAAILNNLGSLYYALGRRPEASPLLARAVEIWSKADPAPDGLGAALHNLAAVYRAQGRYSEAAALYERALKFREDRGGSASLALLPLLDGLALADREQGEYERARQAMDRALAIARAHEAERDASAAEAFEATGVILDGQGRVLDAEGLLQKAIEIREQLFGAEDIHVAGTLCDLALVFRHEGQPEKSAQLYRRALAIYRRTPDTSAEWSVSLELGRTLAVQGRHGEAESALRQALQQAEHQFGSAHPNVAIVLSSLANELSSRHKYDQAAMLLQRAQEIDRKNFDPGDPKIGSDLMNAASLAFKQKEYVEAETMLQQAKAILENRLPPNHLEMGKIAASLAEIRRVENRLDESASLYSRSIEIMEQAWGPENPQLLPELQAYSNVLRAKQDYASAAGVDSRIMKIRVKQALHAARSGREVASTLQ